MEVNTKSLASVNFTLDRELRLSRSATQLSPLDGSPTAYIYSRAMDGINGARVATVSIANYCGLTEEQETALVDRIADEIIAPGFSDEEIEDVAFEIMDCDGTHTTICDHHRDRARQCLENITARRRLNLSGAR